MDYINLENTVSMVSEGVLYFKKKPIYIIERVQSESEVVIVYEVENAQADYPEKAYTIKKEVLGIQGGTVIGDELSRRLPKSVKKRKVEKDPLFIAPLVEGTDTITKKTGLGFFERQPDTYDIATKTMVEGKRTGVFIHLDSIDWRRTYVPKDFAIKRYNELRQEMELGRYERDRFF